MSRKTIIITGASSGIGHALAEHLAKTDNKIILVGRNVVALNTLQQLHSNNTTAVVADITKAKDLLKIQECLPSSPEGVYLIHNAGIATPALLKNIFEEEWDKHYLTNTKAPIFLTKLLLPYLKNGGRVLNVSTGLAHHALAGFAAYGISKASLYMWKEYCNAEFKDENIAFASAMPGIVDTPIQENIRNQKSDDISAIKKFQEFKERDELFAPSTVAKFLSWLLFETTTEQFIKGEWDINDVSHHEYWAEVGDIKHRKK